VVYMRHRTDKNQAHLFVLALLFELKEFLCDTLIELPILRM
jgi:hypothetical protein